MEAARLFPAVQTRNDHTGRMESHRNLIGVPAFSGILQQLLTYHVPPLTNLPVPSTHSQVIWWGSQAAR